MNDYERLNKLYCQIDELISIGVTRSSEEFQIWYKNATRFLAKHFGENSIELNEFQDIRFDLMLVDVSTNDRREKCKKDLKIAKGMFEDFLEDIKPDVQKENKSATVEKFDKVFIVHGHDDALKLETARIIEKQGIKAIILHEQVNGGIKSILDKIEDYKNTVSAAVILFTPDDKGKSIKEKTFKSRARQNVVLEAGYFIGHLGRDRVIPIVSDENIEMPGDLAGIVYNKDNWQFKLIKELEAIGFNVDANKLSI